MAWFRSAKASSGRANRVFARATPQHSNRVRTRLPTDRGDHGHARVDRSVQATQAEACPSGGAFRYHRLCLALARSIPPSNKESSS